MCSDSEKSKLFCPLCGILVAMLVEWRCGEAVNAFWIDSVLVGRSTMRTDDYQRTPT